MPKMILTEMEEDGLKEIINIGAGTTAKILSEMMDGAKIDLGIPAVNIFNFSELDEHLSERKAFSGIKLEFSGAYTGCAILVFSEASANGMVELIMKEMEEEGEVQALREGTLSEIGNIVVSGLMGTVANMVEKKFIYSLPCYMEGGLFPDFFGLTENSNVISADVTFSVAAISSNCELYIVFEDEKIKDFLQAIMDYFES